MQSTRKPRSRTTKSAESPDDCPKSSTRDLKVLIASICFFALGLIGTLQLPLGTFSKPGPGLWPLIAVSIGATFNIIAIVECYTRRPDRNDGDEEGTIDTIKLTLFFVLIAGFLIAYSYLGFLVSGIAMMLLMLKFVSRASWKTSIAVSVISTGGLYLVFSELLNVSL